MIRTYKYRLYPNKSHRKVINTIFYAQRTLYNMALEHRIDAYKETGKSVGYVDQWDEFKQIRKDCFTVVNATSLQQLLRRLDKSFTAFFRRLKSGDKPGFPRFKGIDRFKSIEFRHNDGVKYVSSSGKHYLRWHHVGLVRIKLHRSIPDGSNIKHVVIKQVNGKFYVSFMLEIPDVVKHHNNIAVGIDLGISHLATLSDGTFIDSPKYYIQGQKKLRVLQRSVARKKKGSNTRKKSVKLLAKHHEKIANQRLDFLHRKTRHITDKYGLIVMEKLSLAFMNTNKHLAKHSLDVAMGAFTHMIQYKAEDAGSRVVFVNPKNTSQKCSACGKLVKKSLSVRVHNCDCGLSLDRDLNASRNIVFQGLDMSLEPLKYQAADCFGSKAVCFS